MFERFDSRYDLRGRLITKTALHIGAGGSLAVVGSDNPVVRDVNGLPYIPGSSFKGSLRSLTEAIVRALSPGDRQEPWACDPLTERKWCIPPTRIEQWQQAVRNNRMTQEQVDQLVWDEACTVCRLFGSPWLASKVKVADLYLNPVNEPNIAPNRERRQREGDPEWRGRVEVRDGVAIDRDTETAATGRKYDFEVVPRETAFDLHIRVDNATSEELGLLFLGLDEFTKGGTWLGGNTSRGLGVVHIEWDEFEVVEGRHGLLAYLRSGRGDVKSDAAIEMFISEKAEAFLNRLTEGGKGSAQEAPQPSGA